MAFRKVERSYHSTPYGWRLATFEEARNGLETIKNKNLLNKWDRVRLLDGWITGPGYNYEMGNSFKGCLGYMLLIQTEASGTLLKYQTLQRSHNQGAYADVYLSDQGKEVALFLCVDDWNYEVIYWLLNSWSNSESMNIWDVKGRNIPISNVEKFEEMNEMIGHVARKLGEEGGAALEKAGLTKYSGKDSVKEVLSGMIKIVTEEKDIVQLIGRAIYSFTWYKGDEYCVPDSVKTEDVAEEFWNFVCDSFAGYVVEICANRSLEDICNMQTYEDMYKMRMYVDICKMKTKITSQNNLMIATSILLHLSHFRNDIMHEPMAHHCKGSCAEKILCNAAEKAAGDPQKFNEMLKNNAMWRCYDDMGNYGVLSKLLFIVTKAKYQGEKIAGKVADMLMQCGAQPGRRYAIGKYINKTVLHAIAKFRDKDLGTKVAQALLRSCDERSIYEFVNAADERGTTALHTASQKGNARICGLLVDHGALVKAQDEKGMTALHYAVEGGFDKVIDAGTEVAQALLRRCDDQSIYEFVNAADEKGRTALHRASEKGNARICGLLVDRGALVKAQDKKGMTALHYALEGRIDKVIDVLVKSPHVTESLDLKDKRGRTPLDIALANKDYESTAKLLLMSEEPSEAYLDKALPNVDYETAAMLLSKSKEPEGYFSEVNQEHLLRNSLLLGYVNIVDKLFKNGIRLPAGDCDEEEKTALHLAAMCDNESNAIEIIFSKLGIEAPGDVENIVAKKDKQGRTVLHEAALKGHEKLCEGLLDLNSELIYIKDKDGRNPLYDMVKGEYKGTGLYKQLLDAYLERDNPEDDLMDRSGLTPLHVAASQGKAQVVKELLSSVKIKRKYLSRGDILAQTALHKAVKRGDIETVEILLNHGAHPLRERDCDGRTALHYAVQAETEDKEQLAHKLFERCESDEEESLLLWASAAGLGTADQYLSKDDPLHSFFEAEKKAIREKSAFRTDNLLQMAASMGDIEMTKELISRGYQIGDIQDAEWKKRLKPETREIVERVSRQLNIIPERGNDHPSLSDDLGRFDYARGLAALFLNPELKPPITVGICGAWGMGKSSLMVQTESILLTTAAQMALLTSSKLSSSALELPPDIQILELSKEGKKKYDEIERQLNRGQKSGDSLRDFLNKYDPKHHKIFKSLAAMDASYMYNTNAKLPAVLTVQYNAWKYKNDTEALAGMAVEITRELEGIMTHSQWLSTCLRNTWKQKKHTLLIEFFPCLLALVLACSLTWIAWVAFDSDMFKGWAKAKYAWLPVSMVIVVWQITKSVTGVLKPVSSQLVNYISLPDHTDKLGYQERVISDIKFLKQEIGKEPYGVFTAIVCVFNTIAVLWRLITECWLASLLFYPACLEREIQVPKVAPARTNLRIIVFVDDLDRCDESVILQVLSAINLVLAVCEISVVLSMDKEFIQKAIIKKYGDVKYNKCLKARQELADRYLQKIIQLPLDLPHPSEIQSTRFLKVQLGVFSKGNKDHDHASASETYAQGKRTSKPVDDGMSIESSLLREGKIPSQHTAVREVAINVRLASYITGVTEIEAASDTTELRSPPRNDRDTFQRRKEAHSQTDDDAGNEKSTSVLISDVRNLVFIRYSQGELDAFCFFHALTINSRQFLPREWKVILNYHGLVRNILCLNNEARNVYGWKVQLIAWIFICWLWEENMNILIEEWNEIRVLKTSEFNGPSLQMIIDHFIKLESKKNMMVAGTSLHEEEETNESILEDRFPKNKIFETESSKKEQKKMGKMPRVDTGPPSFQEKKANEEEGGETRPEGNINDQERSKRAGPGKLENSIKEQLDTSEKTLRNELDKLKKEIRDLKGLKQMKKNEKGAEEKRRMVYKWERLRSALDTYDVPMDGIQVFQRFRFNCISGHLPWPLVEQES